MTTTDGPTVHAGAVNSELGGWLAHVSVVRLFPDETSDKKINETTLAMCQHRHRMARSARDCAMKLARQRDVRRAVSEELAR